MWGRGKGGGRDIKARAEARWVRVGRKVGRRYWKGKAVGREECVKGKRLSEVRGHILR